MKFPRLVDRVVHVPFDRGKFFEVSFNDFRCLCSRDAKVLRQAEGRTSIENAKVYFFSLAPHVRVNLFRRNLENASGCSGMNVSSRSERFNHCSVASEGRSDAKLDLGVVGRHEKIVIAPRDKRLPNGTTFLRSYRDVLQVWVVRTQASRYSPRLAIVSVNASVAFTDHPRQGVDVRGAEFLILPIIENLFCYFMLISEAEQNIFTGGVLPGLCFLRLVEQLHLVEEN